MVACSTVESGGDGVPMTPVCEDPPGQKIDGKNFVGPASGGSGGNSMSSPFEDCLWGRDNTERCVDKPLSQWPTPCLEPSFELGHDTGARPEGSNWDTTHSGLWETGCWVRTSGSVGFAIQRDKNSSGKKSP
jgi:hypothetical protein